MKKHNFSAGPSILADEVISKASKSVIELNNIGLSLIEISHRSPDFVAIMEKARELSLELLNLDKEKVYSSLSSRWSKPSIFNECIQFIGN